MRETREEGGAVVQARSEKAMNEDDSDTGINGGAEITDIAQM